MIKVLHKTYSISVWAGLVKSSLKRHCTSLVHSLDGFAFWGKARPLAQKTAEPTHFMSESPRLLITSTEKIDLFAIDFWYMISSSILCLASLIYKARRQ